MCVCGKSSIPWVHQQTKSDINNNILQLQTLQNTSNSFGYSLPLEEEELKMSICTERIRIEKDRLLAAFDLVVMMKGTPQKSCSWGKYAAAAAATHTPITRKTQEDAVRQLISRSQLCLECALNLANSSWQDTTLLTKSSSQNKLSSPAGDDSLDCSSLTPLLDEVLEVDTKSSNVDSNYPSDEEQREELIMLPLFDSTVLESKFEKETGSAVSIECHYAPGTEEQQGELIRPPDIVFIHRQIEASQISNILIKSPDTPEDNFRNDRNKEERDETSCDSVVRREKESNHKEEVHFILGVQSFDTLVLDHDVNEETEGTVSTVRQIDVWRRKFGSVSLLTHDTLDLPTSCAVYHAPEVESVRVAEDAMTCIGDGGKTVFEEFRLLFPFDVTKPSCFI
jgi:hypothetical protein